MAENKQNTTPERRPDCVTEIRMGNTVLVVSGFFKKDTTDTAADKMMKVLEAEAAAGHIITVVNKVAPEETPKKAPAVAPTADTGAMDAIKAAVEILTAGKGQVIKIEKL